MTLYHYAKYRLPAIQLFQPVDMAVWVLVLIFFCASAAIFSGDLTLSFLGAAGIIIVMFFIGAAVEVIIETIKDVKGLGTIVGFITNAPEALCLVVGLVVGDVLFAASTPLGSNIMNPLLLAAAALITGKSAQTFRTHPGYFMTCVPLTAGMAVSFFFLSERFYPFWLAAAVLITSFLFVKRPPEPGKNEGQALHFSRIWFVLAFAVLAGAGYFLDPIVSFAADHSHAPKGVIGFFVLATLTSWPEFKSTLALLKRGAPLAAILNITVSNITNIWLAVIGVAIHLL